MSEPSGPVAASRIPDGGDAVARKGAGARLTLLAGLIASVGWLASSLGAIGAILYASGYLISVAQLHLLGLGRLVTYSHDHYVQQGGSFFVVIGTEIMIAAEYFSIVAVPIVAIYALLHWSGAAHRPWRDRLEAFVSWHRWPWRGIAYVLLVVLLYLVSGDPQSFGRPLTLSNLLFLDPSATLKAGGVDRVESWLIVGDSSRLAVQFEQRLFTYLWVLLLFAVSVLVTHPWPLRRLAVAPFALLLLVYTILLPMLFGVLKLEVEFPMVTVHTSGDAPRIPDGPTFLLTKGDQDLILFEAASRKVVWLRQERVERIEVSGIAPILRPAALPTGDRR